MALACSSSRLLAWALILGTLAGCSTLAPEPEAPPPAPEAAAPVRVTGAVQRPRALWVAASWSELPGWDDDRVAQVWPALRAGCARPAPGWAATCARALAATPADDGEARSWLRQWLQPWRIESLDGVRDGLATGYFEPLVEASRRRVGRFKVPLYGWPAGTPLPTWTRAQSETLPAAQAALRGHEIAWVADPLDALLLQIQGSGRLLVNEPDGSRHLVRLAFAGHNDQPYRSVGAWLIQQGEIAPGAASWPAIRAWARLNPQRVQQLLWANPRLVFFREEPLADPKLGPRGGQGVALVPGRSIAVDPASIPYGTAVWIETTEPLSSTPLRRIVMAQDTGGAIVGAVRADLFWGWGAEAEAQAGRMKQPLRVWALWPRGGRPEGVVSAAPGSRAVAASAQ
ncbi:MAG: MltA domain-containing protein [Burkholderiales bacterium]|nr:MltA domain-containing protein [Burkholderiales bacterium]